MTDKVESRKSLNTKFLWIGLIAVIAILGGTWAEFNDASSTESAAAGGLEPLPVAGHPAPDFTLKNLEGEEVSLSDFRGQPVVINFWATWCGPCRVEMPDFQQAHTELQDEGLVIIGVNLTERDDPDDIPAFLDEFGITFPIVLDEDGDVAKTYKVFGQPSSIFMDKDGIVHQVFYGPVNKAFIEARIAEILGS